MSINKIIDVWNEDGYMMQSCVAYEDAYENVEYYLKALEAVDALDGSVTIKTSVARNMSRVIRELLATSKQAIGDKSECIQRLKNAGGEK